MTNYIPDNWIVVKIKGEDPHYRVLAGWSGGYTTGSSWRLNSGITRVVKKEKYHEFFGHSGTTYLCHDEGYGLKMNNAHIWAALQKMHGDLVEIMPEETDWLAMDWIIS